MKDVETAMTQPYSRSSLVGKLGYSRFRDLQPGHDDGLRAEWSEPEGRSHLAYIGTDIHILSEPRMAPLSVRRRFKSAAARAAALMSLSTSEAPDAWLDYLRGDEQTHALKALFR